MAGARRPGSSPGSANTAPQLPIRWRGKRPSGARLTMRPRLMVIRATSISQLPSPDQRPGPARGSPTSPARRKAMATGDGARLEAGRPRHGHPDDGRRFQNSRGWPELRGPRRAFCARWGARGCPTPQARRHSRDKCLWRGTGVGLLRPGPATVLKPARVTSIWQLPSPTTATHRLDVGCAERQ